MFNVGIVNGVQEPEEKSHGGSNNKHNNLLTPGLVHVIDS